MYPECAYLRTMAYEAQGTVSNSLAAQLEQVARSIHTVCFAEGMHPVQWSALRYFARAPEKRRTVSGLARHLGVTQPPASRTVSTLIGRGYLKTEVDRQDRRSRTVSLTAAGHRLLELDPLLQVEVVLGRLSPVEHAALSAILSRLEGAITPCSRHAARSVPMQDAAD